MANHATVTMSKDSIASLSQELSRIAHALAKVSANMQTLVKRPVRTVRVTPKTDPDMFTKEFIETVRTSRRELAQGKSRDYREFRKTLNLS